MREEVTVQRRQLQPGRLAPCYGLDGPTNAVIG